MAMAKRGESVGLPVRAFLFTLDQCAYMLGFDDIQKFKMDYVHFQHLTVGSRSPHKLFARNISPTADQKDWRVSEAEMIRWLRLKGFRIYDKAWVNG